HTGRPKMTSRNHTRKVPTGVQVCDVEGSRVIRHISVEAEWDEKLQVIRQPVRQIWKDPDGDAVSGGRFPRLKPPARDFLPWQPPLVVADVRRADGDGMSSLRESPRERVRETRDAAVRPCVLEVRRDVQDSE